MPPSRKWSESGEEMRKMKREESGWGGGGVVRLLFTGHPRHWASRQLWLLALLGSRRLFCAALSLLLFRVARRVVLVQSPVAPLSSRDRSSAFFHGFFLLPPRSPTAGFDTNSAPDLLPLFPQCARAPLFFQIYVSLGPFLSVSFCLFLPFLPLSRARPSRVLVHFAR